MELYKQAAFADPIAAFDAAVEEWHEAETGQTVYEWLGMDEHTYWMFVRHPEEMGRAA